MPFAADCVLQKHLQNTEKMRVGSVRGTQYEAILESCQRRGRKELAWGGRAGHLHSVYWHHDDQGDVEPVDVLVPVLGRHGSLGDVRLLHQLFVSGCTERCEFGGAIREGLGLLRSGRVGHGAKGGGGRRLTSRCFVGRRRRERDWSSAVFKCRLEWQKREL